MEKKQENEVETNFKVIMAAAVDINNEWKPPKKDGEINMGSVNEYIEWNAKFNTILPGILELYDAGNSLKSIRRKEFWNGVFAKLRLPWRFSTTKERWKINGAIKAIFLSINDLSDKDIIEIKKVQKNSVEGIRREAEEIGIPLYGVNYGREMPSVVELEENQKKAERNLGI